MASRKGDSSANAPVLDEKYWLRFGEDPDPDLRQKLIYTCIGEMSRRGILDVSARSLSELLGVSHPAINYHFGSFDGLIAEAYAHAYRDFTDTIIRSAGEPAKSLETGCARSSVARRLSVRGASGPCSRSPTSLIPRIRSRRSSRSDSRASARMQLSLPLRERGIGS